MTVAVGDRGRSDRAGLPLTIRAVAHQDRTKVIVAGEIDLASAPNLAAHLDLALTCHSRVIVDLRPVRFLDCSAVRVLVAARRQARARGGDLHLLAAPRWARIIDLTGADLPIIDNNPSTREEKHRRA